MTQQCCLNPACLQTPSIHPAAETKVHQQHHTAAVSQQLGTGGQQALGLCNIQGYSRHTLAAAPAANNEPTVSWLSTQGHAGTAGCMQADASHGTDYRESCELQQVGWLQQKACCQGCSCRYPKGTNCASSSRQPAAADPLSLGLWSLGLALSAAAAAAAEGMHALPLHHTIAPLV
jgi:hypothetical protein